jgi:hypothetical protein
MRSSARGIDGYLHALDVGGPFTIIVMALMLLAAGGGSALHGSVRRRRGSERGLGA